MLTVPANPETSELVAGCMLRQMDRFAQIQPGPERALTWENVLVAIGKKLAVQLFLDSAAEEESDE